MTDTRESIPAIDIRPDHWVIVRDILHKHVPQYAVWAFGSRAKWTAKEFSDLDLAIITDSPLPLTTSAALADDFSESDLPWKVDIVDWAETNETFRQIIDRDRVVVQEVLCSDLARVNEWQEVSLSQLFKVKHGFAFKGEYFTDEVQDTVLVTPGNFSIGGGFQDEKRKYYRGPIPQDYVLKPGDIVVTMTDLSKESDTLGYAARIPNGEIIWLHNQRVGLLEFNKDFSVSPRFVQYLLRMHEYRAWIVGSATGTTVKHTSPSRIERFVTRIPPIEEQRAIAHILGALDDKIELNRRMNETLETMARSLFTSWFVDFDTVPSEDIQESELGLIPKGWRVAPLSSALEIIGGGTPKTSVAKYWNGDIPWFSVVDTPAASDVFVITTEKGISQSGLEESSARLISKGTTIISARGTVGNLALAARDMTFNQSCYGLKGKQGIGDYFVFLTAQRMVDQLQSMAHGSVFSTITRQTFDAIRIAIPPVALFEKFEKEVSVWFDKILNNVQQTQELIQLRDNLLPKLISGEVRLKDAENVVESIV